MSNTSLRQSAAFSGKALKAVVLVLGFLLVSTVMSGCTEREVNEFGSPEDAAYGTLDALRYARARPEQAWAVLDQESQAALEQAASRARSEGVEVSHPATLIRVGHLPGKTEIREIERVRVTSSEAELILHTYLDQEFLMHLEREGSLWTISLVGE